MPSIIKYPGTIAQSEGNYKTGKQYTKFTNINNIKSDNSAYARASLTGNAYGHPRPSNVILTNFGFKLPTGAEVTSVVVEYAHQKVKGNKGAPNISAPTISLLNVSGQSAKGVAPTTSMKANSKQFTFKPSKSVVESSKFGVKINYPENNNNYAGYVDVKYVRIKVNYIAPKYSVSISKKSGKPVVGGTVRVQTTINNLNKTSYNPNVVISLPEGVRLSRVVSGSGSFTNNGDNVVWKTGLNKSTGSATFVMDLYLSRSGSKTITASNTLNSNTVSKSLNLNVNLDDSSQTVIEPTEGANVVISSDDDYDDVEKIYATVGETVSVNVILNDVAFSKDYVLFKQSSNALLINNSNSMLVVDNESLDSETQSLSLELSTQVSGRYTLDCIPFNSGDNVNELPVMQSFEISFIKGDLTYPVMNIIKLEGEQLNRLEHGRKYTVASFLKLVVDQEDIEHIIDCIKNFRIGVCNSIQLNQFNAETVFDNATEWSSMITSPNSYVEKRCEFTYDSSKDLYIVITGDYLECFPEELVIKFTSPVIIESEVYTSYDTHNIFPEPILNTISNDDFASLSLGDLQSSNPFVVQDFEVCDDFETNDNMAICGIGVLIDVESCDGLSISAKLKTPYGECERSIILNEKRVGEVEIGGTYDSWGFKISEMKKIKDWEVIFTMNNLWNNESSSFIQFNNVRLVLYYNTIEDQLVKIYVNGEDTRHYGMFVDDIDIPSGLNSEVKYFEVKGVDANNPYRMNIDKKEITIDFNVFGCNLEETIVFLKRIAKLFTNARDALNNPILNRLECSLYPGEHWDVLMETGIDTDTKDASYSSKLKLEVPNGTSWSNEDIVTANTGFVDSIVRINPIITITSPQNLVEIREEYTNQNFTMFSDDFTSNDVILIDCVDHKAYKKVIVDGAFASRDISDTVDWNADWFILQGDFNFITNGSCVIQAVQFTPRG